MFIQFNLQPFPDDEQELKENWDEQLDLEWDDSLIDTPLSNAR